MFVHQMEDKRSRFLPSQLCFNCFLLVKFMSDEERTELENEDRFLKMLLDFYQEHDGDLSMNDGEREQHIDAILERIWEIKQLLND